MDEVGAVKRRRPTGELDTSDGVWRIGDGRVSAIEQFAHIAATPLWLGHRDTVTGHDLRLEGKHVAALGVDEHLQPVHVVGPVRWLSPKVSMRVKFSSRRPCASRSGLSIRK